MKGSGTTAAGELSDIHFIVSVHIGYSVPHLLVNTGKEPFGFFCAVDAVRDEPEPLKGEALSAILADPGGGTYIKTGTAFSCGAND